MTYTITILFSAYLCIKFLKNYKYTSTYKYSSEKLVCQMHTSHNKLALTISLLSSHEYLYCTIKWESFEWLISKF